MWRQSSLFILVSMVYLLLSHGAVVAQRIDMAQAIVIATGDDHLLHALPLSSGHVLIHTTPSTGVMKPFLDVERDNAKLSDDFDADVDAGYEVVQRLAGMAVDDQRLYVVVGQQSAKNELGRFRSGESETPYLAGRQHMERTRHTLYVFWRKDASLVHQQQLTPWTPGTLDAETVEKGPLELIDKGVECLGMRCTFDGMDLTKVEVIDDRCRLALPPPDLRDRLNQF